MQLHPEIVVICMLPVVNILLAVVLFTECLWSNLETDHFKNLVVIFKRVSLDSLIQFLCSFSEEYPQKIETLQILQILYQVRRCLDPEIWRIGMIENILILFLCWIFWVSFLQGNMVSWHCFRILFSSASAWLWNKWVVMLPTYPKFCSWTVPGWLSTELKNWSPRWRGDTCRKECIPWCVQGYGYAVHHTARLFHLWESLARSLTLGTAYSI